MNFKKKIIIESIKQNILLESKKLVFQSFGNVSLKLDKNHIVIKPSGVLVKNLKLNDMPILRISDGKLTKGKLKPSVDTPTHIEIYKFNSNIKSVAHTHSIYATGWAQTGKSIPNLGTTHSDYWQGEIPNVEFITKKRLKQNYELETGKLIISALKKRKLDFENCPGVLVRGHGVFTWGTNHFDSVNHAEILESVAKIAYISISLKIKNKIPKYLIDKHYNRKHGKKSYYGQKK